MKNPVRLLIATALVGWGVLAAQAQSAQKTLVIDMAQVFSKHYRTVEQEALLQADKQKATEELQRQAKELDGLAKELQDMDEQLKNPAITEEAKKKVQEVGSQKVQVLQQRERDFQARKNEINQSFQQRINNLRVSLFEDISKVATDIAKSKGATFLVDKTGPLGLGVPVFLYADASADITDDVIKAINANKPVSAVPAAAPAADTPAITVPKK